MSSWIDSGDAAVTPVVDAGTAARKTIRSWAEEPQRAVIFDFNGTLANDEPILLDIFAELFAAHLAWPMPAADYYARLAGHSDREIVEIAVAEHAGGDADLVEDLLLRRRSLYQRKVAAHSPITPDTAALVRRLAAEKVPMAIVTGAQRDDVRCVLASSPVGDHLTVLVTEEDVTHGKPHPEGFHRGAELLGVDPAHILVFEDSVPGYRGAVAAGMRCVLVEGTRTATDLASITPSVVPRLASSLLDTSLLDT